MGSRDPEWRAELNRQSNRDRRWKRTLPAPPDGRRTIPIRLSDIPLDTRLSAARVVNQHEHDDAERLAVFHAALFPSDDVHWVAA